MLRIANQTPRYSLLQRLQRIGQRILLRFAEHGWPIQAVFWLEWGSFIFGRIPLWFAEQQVNMLRHDYVPAESKDFTSKSFRRDILAGGRFCNILIPKILGR